jgi:hypothetical protein
MISCSCCSCSCSYCGFYYGHDDNSHYHKSHGDCCCYRCSHPERYSLNLPHPLPCKCTRQIVSPSLSDGYWSSSGFPDTREMLRVQDELISQLRKQLDARVRRLYSFRHLILLMFCFIARWCWFWCWCWCWRCDLSFHLSSSLLSLSLSLSDPRTLALIMHRKKKWTCSARSSATRSQDVPSPRHPFISCTRSTP